MMNEKSSAVMTFANRFVNIYFSPKDVFESLKQHVDKTAIIIPLLIKIIPKFFFP